MKGKRQGIQRANMSLRKTAHTGSTLRLAESFFSLLLEVNKNPVFMENKNGAHLVFCVNGFLTKKDKTKLKAQG